MQAVPQELPDYAWASTEPHAAGVVRGGWAIGLTPIADLPEVSRLPDAPVGVQSGLVPVEHPRIRVLGAYWHEGWPHAVPGAWLRPVAFDRLLEALAGLPEPFGLGIWDAWRDPALQAVLHDRVYRDPGLAPGFVAYPDPDPRRCPPHATGGTVDLTLTWRGSALSMGTRFDAFVPQAAAAALEPDGPRLERDLRRLLARVMGGAGFVQHPQEWWHWEYGTRYWSAVTGSAVRFGRARLG
ncbi:MAG: M15 family metallopeptidase [Candidatus Nanopelagicales bacterium]